MGRLSVCHFTRQACSAVYACFVSGMHTAYLHPVHAILHISTARHVLLPTFHAMPSYFFLSPAQTAKQSSAHHVCCVGAAGTRSWTSRIASGPCQSPDCRRPRTRCHTRRHSGPGRAAPDQRPCLCAPACCTTLAPHLQSAKVLMGPKQELAPQVVLSHHR